MYPSGPCSLEYVCRCINTPPLGLMRAVILFLWIFFFFSLSPIRINIWLDFPLLRTLKISFFFRSHNSTCPSNYHFLNFLASITPHSLFPIHLRQLSFFHRFSPSPFFFSLDPLLISFLRSSSRGYAYIHVDMVIHRHRRWYVNKLDSSFVAALGREGCVRASLDGNHSVETKRPSQPSNGVGGGEGEKQRKERKCKRLSSRTHDPDDRIQIYWPFAEQRRERKARGPVRCERKPGILRSWFRIKQRLCFALLQLGNLPEGTSTRELPKNRWFLIGIRPLSFQMDDGWNLATFGNPLKTETRYRLKMFVRDL